MRGHPALAAAVAGALLAGCTSATTHLPGPRVSASAGTSPFRPAPPGHCQYREPGNLPDPACTPGAPNPAVTQGTIRATICRSGWTATIRPATGYTDSLKARQMAVYGLGGAATGYEEDHRIPLEVGGNPADPANLWPEPWAGQYGAHAKDAVENRVHREVCAGTLTLAAGRAIFTGDWWASPGG